MPNVFEITTKNAYLCVYAFHVFECAADLLML